MSSTSPAECPTEERGLHFVLVTTFYPPYHFGGDGIHVRRLAHALAARNHRVDVIHSVDAFHLQRPGVEPTPLPEPPGVTVHALRSRFGALSCLATHQLGRPLLHSQAIRRILEEGSPDVIHYHNISLVGGPGILAYGDAIKLYTTHEYWLVCPTHVLWRHGREACEERECTRCLIHHRRPPQAWRWTGLLKRSARHVDVFCSPSRSGAELHAKFGFEQSCEVLPLFLPEAPEGLQPSTQVEQAERPYYLFVGRLEKLKGLQDVIPSFEDDSPADLWIAGSGDYEPELRRLAQGKERVRFLGQVALDSLRELYAGALAVIAPSLCYEVFPMVLLEAFREGTPVVARRIGPYPDAVEVTGAGLLFETRVELEQALVRVAQDSELREQLGSAGRAVFQERWREAVVMEAYFSMITRVARERGLQRVADYLERGN